MTRPSYPSQLELLKSSRQSIGCYEVIADGEVHRSENYVAASLLAHEMQGRLYKVIRDTEAMNGFRRIPESPLALEVAKDISARTPRKPALRPSCVPVFGR